MYDTLEEGKEILKIISRLKKVLEINFLNRGKEIIYS